MSAEEIGRRAAEALRVEARLTPKPGLVDSNNPGAHTDMDLELMLLSADTLEPFFIELARSQADAELVKTLGLRADAAMRQATGGVNTHQGAIYSLGLLCAAIGAGADEVETACIAAGNLAVQIVLLDSPNPILELLSTREAAAKLGFGGARAEAASGFSTVRTLGLPVLRRKLKAGWSEDDALLTSLLYLMTSNEDTNLVQRGGPEELNRVQIWANNLLYVELTPAELRRALLEADEDFIRRNLSPGGSADLLAVTWFLSGL